MMKTTTLLALLVSVLFGTIGVSWAGSLYVVKCTDDKCGFKGLVGIGGSRKDDQATGFCEKCSEIVSIRWRRGDKAIPFGDPTTWGKLRYKCPKCGEPFIAITDIEEFRLCPKCKKATLEHKLKLIYD